MEEIDLKEIFNIFWTKKIFIILIVILFTILGVIYTKTLVIPEYQSATKLLLAVDSSTETVAKESITTTDVTLNSNLVSTYSELVKSNKIIRAVISNLQIDETEESIRKSVKVTAVSDTEVIEINVTNQDPALAARIANEIAKVFIETIKEYYGIENVHIVDEAEIAETPCNINHVKDVIIFMFVGFVISSIYILISYMLDNSVKSVEDVETLLGVRVLASLPFYEISLENVTKNKRKSKGEKRK